MNKKDNVVAIPLDRPVQIGDIYKNVTFAVKPFGYADRKGQGGIGFLKDSDTKHLVPHQLVLLSDDEVTTGYDSHVIWEGKLYTMGRYSTMRADYSKCNRIIAAYPELHNVPILSEKFIKIWINNPIGRINIEPYMMNRSIREIARDFIKKCNIHNMVSAKEGGIIELDTLLIDFVRDFYTKDKIKKIIEEYDEYVESHIDREQEAALCCHSPISGWNLDEWFDKFIEREFKK